MELDNGMVIGAMPYCDPPHKTEFVCPWCGETIPPETDVYRWPKNGRACMWLCGDCLKSEIENASPPELVELMGLDVERAGETG